jgi:xanthine dehydrogenase accessory factor
VGLTEDELARMASPIGLDLGARTPEETAVSIAAEMIALQWGGGGSRLADREGPIHTTRQARSAPSGKRPTAKGRVVQPAK